MSQGLPTNTIEGISIDGVHLKAKSAIKKCSLVKGTYRDCAECAKCKGLTPA